MNAMKEVEELLGRIKQEKGTVHGRFYMRHLISKLMGDADRRQSAAPLNRSNRET